jgi:hypothetical protein
MKKFSITTFFFVFLIFPFLVRADSLILSGADFVPVEDTTYYAKGTFFMYLKSGSPDRTFVAQIHLPQDARVTSMVVFYQDFDATGNLHIYLVKQNVYTQNYDDMVDWESSGTPGYTSHKISPILAGNKIDNNGYSYTCELRFTSSTADVNVRLYKIKINYN